MSLDLLEIRKRFKQGESIFSMELRVVYYGRVSSSSDEQLNSITNQVTYFEDFINKNPKWQKVGQYLDEGIRGESVKKRKQFLEMIEDAKQDKFDLVLTKEISRFARNTLDSIKYTRELLNHGVGVLFLNDNINTLDEDSELRLTIMSSIYQDEVRKLSSRVKFGHSEAIKKGVVIGNSRIYGYRKEKGKLIIDEPEAEMVRLIYDCVANQDMSLRQIEKFLYEKGYRSRAGGKIMHNTIGAIVRNPKYKGYYCGNKVKIVDYMTKEQRFLPENEWVIWRDDTGNIVPAIVDEGIWQAANEKVLAESDKMKARIKNGYHSGWGKNELSDKIYCSHCNLPYWRNTITNRTSPLGNEFWSCSGKRKYGKEHCKSIALYPDNIVDIVQDSLQDLISNFDYYFNQYIQYCNEFDTNAAIDTQLKNNRDQYERLIKKKNLLLDLLLDATISKKDFAERNQDLSDQIDKLDTEYDQLIASLNAAKNLTKDFEKFKKLVKSAIIDENGKFTIETIAKLVKRINVSEPDSNGNIQAEIILKNDKKYEKDVALNELRAGHINKRICPERKYEITRTNRHAINYRKEYCIHTHVTI